MNEYKFAPMTASLLARKGYAAPSLGESARHVPAWQNERTHRPSPILETPWAVLAAEEATFPHGVAATVYTEAKRNPTQAAGFLPAPATSSTKLKGRTPPPADKPRRIMVLVTPHEIERLGIAAIKKGKTRHEILRAALDAYLCELAAEFPGPCHCLGASPT